MSDAAIESEVIGAQPVDPAAARRQANALTLRLLLEFQLGILPVAPALTYVATRLAGLEGTAALVGVAKALLPAVALTDLAYIGFVFSAVTRHALAPHPTDRPGDRLTRLLQLPQRWWLQGLLVGYTLGGAWVGTSLRLLYGAPLAIIAHCILLGIIGGLVAGVPLALRVQELVLPLAIEEYRRTGVRPRGSGLLWMRQSWFVPLAFAVMLFGTLGVVGEVLIARLAERDRAFVASVVGKGADEVRALGDAFVASGPLDVLPPTFLVVCGTLLLSIATSWFLSRRLARSSSATLLALESTLKGAAVPVEWVSTDELGDLAESIVQLQASLAELPVTLGAASMRLSNAGRSLDEAVSSQTASVGRQASAVQETHVTVEEMRRTSAVAVERAKAASAATERAAEIGKASEAALAASANGIEAIRTVVEEMRTEMGRLAERARQIGGISETVKSLADQSNMLALNAAIEAVRSGEHGKGFAVVAREIRSLADQSIQATGRIRSEVQHVEDAIQGTVLAGTRGVGEVESILQRVRESGEQLRELIGNVQENASAVRQIVAAIEQQNQGTEQIFAAVAELSGGMKDAMARLESTQQAAGAVRGVTDVLGRVADRYRRAG